MHPQHAWLTGYLCPTPSLANLLISSLIRNLVAECKSDLSIPPPHSWERMTHLCSALLNIMDERASSISLTLNQLELLVSFAVEVANGHFKCCGSNIVDFIDCIAVLLSYNTRHADVRWCEQSLKLILNVIMKPSQEFPTDPPESLTLPLLTAVIGAAPCAVRDIITLGYMCAEWSIR